MKVYVFVTLYHGVEEETRVFRRTKDADSLYRKFAKTCGVPYHRKLKDYDWSAVGLLGLVDGVRGRRVI